tara:strand:- start:102 stop:1325 length:1224 start_codon:yes stop_codon:yes gene_type:complete
MECFRCQGRLYQKPLVCGHKECPIYSKVKQFKTQKIGKQDFMATAPGVFVGRHAYPDINVGIIAPPEQVKEAELYDSPKEWVNRNLNIPDIVNFRSVLINSRFKANVKQKTQMLNMSQEVAMASKPVDLEFNLKKKPFYFYKTSNIESPMGAVANLKKVTVTENIKIDRRVDYIVNDTDLKSVFALKDLFDKGYDENFLTKLLSIGNLGLKKDRKLVPTRWSITAVDDTVGKKMVEEIKDYKESDFKLFFGGYFGNHYLVMFFPRVWSYELFEMYMPRGLLNPGANIEVMTDHEFYDGRKKYAENCVGGYYACRLSILEKLRDMKRQALVLVLRFITEEYTTPLGVWVCREATRKALQSSWDFESKEEMVKFAKGLVLDKFGYDISSNLRESKLYSYMNTQKTLFEF